MTDAWLEKAAQHLEWPRLATAVLARCRGPSAQRRGLLLAADRAQAALMLRETSEALALLERGERVPLQDLRDIEPHLALLEREGSLQASALSDVLITLRNARMLRGLLASQRAKAPALHASCSTDAGLDELEQQLGDALDPDGTLSDRASPELKRLRNEIANLRERIAGRLQQLIEHHGDVLSDRYFTVREGRYVLPVRRDAHEHVAGIVHGTSQSGASVFVEPRAVLAHGNRLKLAESELEREEQRVLSALCERAREFLPSLGAAAEALDRMDLRHASALLGRELDGTVPELCEQNAVELKAARHPLLLLDGTAAVENDIALEAGRGLVISGPNASGKTVLLKTVGLFALMVRHGLPIAAAEGSRVGFFERVLTDIGDEQSTAKSLSTFSAHITNLTAILAAADAKSVVLLDELATGTDPQEGAALACAIVDAVCERGAALAVTTHYEPLKAFSLRDPRLRSASVGFDLERMEPTFELTMDLPGVSSALVVARRFGMPEPVLAFAERVLPQQARDFEALVAELATRTRALDEERAALERERSALLVIRAQEQARLDQLRTTGDARIAREIARLQQEIAEARGELTAARTQLKVADAGKRELAAAEKRISSVAGRVALGGDLAAATPTAARAGAPRKALDEQALRAGARVHVARLRSDAVVVEAPSKGRVRVAVGPLKLWVDSADLSTPDAAPAAPPQRTQSSAVAAPPVLGRTPDNTLNLKGMRVDDALSLMETFIDRLSTTDLRVGYVLHGHGTGALREAVRKHLKEVLPQVRDSRPADASEGGDAVTVFYLA
jgi:DNA mismatch repair protein MutS2